MPDLDVRRLTADDLPARVRWFNTDAVHTQMPVDTPYSLSETEQWFARTLGDSRRRDFVFVARLGDASAAAPVAMGGLVDIDHRHRRAELYIVVDPGLHRMGVGTGSVKWLCRYGFMHLGLERIYLYTLAANEGARRLYERLGFVREGILRRHQFHNGALTDRHIHGLLRSDWELLRQSEVHL